MRIDELRVVEFATPGPFRDWLVELVLAGRKRATAALLEEWRNSGDPMQTGVRYAVLDSASERVAVIETTELRIGTFADVEWNWIVDSGEGDTSVEQWRAGYLRYYEDNLGRRLELSTPVVYERFRLVETAGA